LPRPFPNRDLNSARNGLKLLTPAVVTLVVLSTAIFPTPPALAVTQNQESTSAQTSATPQDQNENSSPATEIFDLSHEIVGDVLTNLQRGMETHNLDRVLAIFDPSGMPNYARFRDQMVAFFAHHDSFKFRYRLLQVSGDKDVAIATADVEMDAEPSDILPTEQRRSTQIRFELKRGPKGWKVIGLRPADFFNQ
jgi:hypothetical protein